jgi:hypothetical protein
MAVSNKVAFTNPNAPVYPRLAQGKIWNEVSLIFVSFLSKSSHVIHRGESEVLRCIYKNLKQQRVFFITFFDELFMNVASLLEIKDLFLVASVYTIYFIL